MSWLSSNLTSSFSEFTNQLSSLTSDVLPAGVLPGTGDDQEETGTVKHEEVVTHAENGTGDQDKTDEERFMLPVSGPVSSQSEYQDATFSPIKDESQLDGNGGVLASTPNASAADFSDFLGDAGSFVGDPKAGNGIGGSNSLLEEVSLISTTDANQSRGSFGTTDPSAASSSSVPADTNFVIDDLRKRVEDGEARISVLLAKHEKELHSLRESHKLKLQAVHDHQQADMEEMEQRISELEGQCQRNELEQQQQQKNAEDASRQSSTALTSLQGTVDDLTIQLSTASSELDSQRAQRESLQSELSQKDKMIASLRAEMSSSAASPDLQKELAGVNHQLQLSEEAITKHKEEMETSLAAQCRKMENAHKAAMSDLSTEHDKLQTVLRACQLQLAEETKRVEELQKAAEETAVISEQLSQEKARCSEYAQSALDLKSLLLSKENKFQSLHAELENHKDHAASTSQQLEDAQRTANLATEKHSQLLAEYTQLSSAHSSLQQALAAERTSAESIRSSSVDATAFEDVNSKLRQSQLELATREQELQALKQSMSTEAQQHDQTITEERAQFSHSREEFSQQISAERARCSELSSQLQATLQLKEAELDRLQSALEESGLRESAVIKQLEEVKASSHHSTEEHSQLLAEYASLHQEYAALQAERESERQAVESLRSSSVNQDTFREMQADLERSQQRALKAEAELATLKEEHLSQMQHQLQTLSEECAQLQQHRDEDSQQLLHEKARCSELSSQLQATLQLKEAELDRLQSALEESGLRESAVIKQLEEVKASSHHSTEEHSQLLAEYASLHQEYAALQAERDSERQAVESLRSSSVNQDTFRETQADLERSQQRALKAEAELTTLKEEHLSQMQHQLQTLSEECAQLQQRRDEVSQQLLHEKAQTEELSSRSVQLEASIQAKNDELLVLRSQCETSETQVNNYCQQLVDLKSKMETVVEQHTALLDEHSRLSSAHAAVQQELAAERQSAETLRTSSVDASTLAEAQALLANSQQQLRAAADELRVLKDTQRREEQEHVQLLASGASDLQRARDEFSSQLSNEQTRYADLLQTFNKLQTDLETKNSEVTSLLASVEERKAHEAALTLAIQDSETKCQALSDEHSKLLGEHSDLCRAHSNLQQELLAEKTELETVRSSSVDASVFSDTQSSLDRCRQQLAEADNTMAALKEEHRSELETLQQAFAGERHLHQEALEKLQQCLAAEQENLKSSHDEQDSLRAKLDEATLLYGQLKEEAVPVEETGRYQREAERLRQHLLLVEEQHTQDLLDSEKVSQDLREELATAQHTAESRVIGAEKDLAHCHQELQSLQERVGVLSEERNVAMQQCAEVEKKAEASGADLARLQLVLEQFQSERDNEVTVALEPLQRRLEDYQSMVEDYKAQLSNYQAAIKEKESFETRLNTALADLEQKQREASVLQSTVNDCQTTLEASQEQLKQCKLALEGKVDANLVRNILLTYLTSPEEKRHEVLRPVARILGFSGNEMKKVSTQQRSWLTSWLGTSVSSPPMSVPSDKTFTELFVQFLESESSTESKAPSLPVATVKDSNISTSQLPASAFSGKSLPLSSSPPSQLTLSRVSPNGSPLDAVKSLTMAKPDGKDSQGPASVAAERMDSVDGPELAAVTPSPLSANDSSLPPPSTASPTSTQGDALRNILATGSESL